MGGSGCRFDPAEPPSGAQVRYIDDHGRALMTGHRKSRGLV
ncbi:Uncharacterised protein [Vibrio cholerae]|nr:Uncharacterised protein [Vibrio cholerae]